MMRTITRSLSILLRISCSYCAGGNLLDLLAVGRNFNERQVAALMQQIFSGVEYCHSRGLVHGQLQPEDIYISSDADSPSSVARVANFGRASVLKPTSTLSARAGAVKPSLTSTRCTI